MPTNHPHRPRDREPESTPTQGDYFDRTFPGFGLRVSPAGRKSFILIYRTRRRSGAEPAGCSAPTPGAASAGAGAAEGAQGAGESDRGPRPGDGAQAAPAQSRRAGGALPRTHAKRKKRAGATMPA